MKCIQSVEMDAIKRVVDTEAHTKVSSGEWKYVAKSIWKASVRTPNKKSTQTTVTEDSEEVVAVKVTKTPKKKKERIIEEKQKGKKRGK